MPGEVNEVNFLGRGETFFEKIDFYEEVMRNLEVVKDLEKMKNLDVKYFLSAESKEEGCIFFGIHHSILCIQDYYRTLSYLPASTKLVFRALHFKNRYHTRY